MSIATVLTISSGIWFPLFFGNAYQKAIEAFNYQAWFGVLLCFDLLLSTVLSSTYRQKVLAIITTIDVFIVFPLLYFGARNGAEGMAIAKLAGVLITVIYHIVVVILVLKIKLNSKPFILSCLYFLALMITSLFIKEIAIKLVIGGVTVGFFCLVKASPLRDLGKLIVDKIRKK